MADVDVEVMEVDETTAEEVLPPVSDPQEAVNPEEYHQLKHDFGRIIQRGLDGFQEKAPGREISDVIMRLQGRYGIVVKTNEKGLIEVPQMCGEEVDNQGRSRKQRMYVGMNCSTSTKKTSFGSVNLLRTGDTTIKEFEVNAAAYELMKKTLQMAQKKGENYQRKIDEEEVEYFPKFDKPTGEEISQNLDIEAKMNIDQVFGLVTLARQTLKRELAAKLDVCDIAFFSIVDTFELTDPKGNKIDAAVPRTGFTIKAKTADGHEVFDAIRGTGGMSALLRYNPDLSYEETIENMAKRVAKRAVDLDRAQPASALGGEAWVLLDGEVSGVLAHEVLGHASEADIILDNKKSKDAELNLKARIGSQVSENSAFFVVDDGNFTVQLGDKTIPNCFGGVVVDEDGMKPKRTPLVSAGIQTSALTCTNSFSEIVNGLPDAIKEGMEEQGPGGNLRSERFDKAPLIRMTNTYILPNKDGPDTLDKMAAMVPKSKKGVYIVNCSGGWVSPDSGDFQVTGQLGYLIENGIITDKPVKDVIVKGNIAKFGSKIKSIGNSATITRTSSGFCGKDSQWVFVDDGGPALLVEDASIGPQRTGWAWQDTYKEYRRQMAEVIVGRRKKSDVFLRFLENEDDDEEETGTEKQINHSNLCLLQLDMPLEDEIHILLGNEPVVSEYIVGEGGQLEDL